MPRPVHFDIHADDPERAAAFYGKVFGWQFQHIAEMDYWLAITGEDGPGINGGIARRNGPALRGDDAVTGAILTMEVEDIDAAIVAIEAEGAAVQMEKSDVPGIGLMAYYKDTEGNLFGIIQPPAS